MSTRQRPDRDLSGFVRRWLGASKPAPRWRNALAVSALALLMGSMGQAAAAPQSIPIAVQSHFKVVKPKAPVCAGQSYPVRVTLEISWGPMNQDFEWEEIPVSSTAFWINASALDAGIGTISPPRLFAGLATLADPVPGEETFTFRAKKAGKARLQFKADVHKTVSGPAGVTAEIDVSESTVETIEVVNCNFKVSTLSLWRIPGPANSSLSAMMNEAQLKFNGTTLTGKGKLSWGAGISGVGDCSGELNAGPTTSVDMYARLLESGWVVLSLTYTPVTAKANVKCGAAGGGSFSAQMTPQTIEFNIPNAGGTASQHHVLRGEDTAQGTTSILVQPVATK